VFAGVIAVAATIAIERLGGRVGGLIATIPSTIVPASLGIAAGSPSVEATRIALYAIPTGMLLNAGFLWLWRTLPPLLPSGSLRRRLAVMTTLSLSAWFLGAWAAVAGLHAIGTLGASAMAVAGWSVTGAMGVVGVLACRSNPPAPRGSRPVSVGTLVLRGSLAASAIGVAVILAAVGGATAAGIASVFPAIFATTMVSLWLAQGEAVPAGAVGPMMLGAAAVAMYACLAAWSLPALGPVAGVGVAWLGAVVTTTLPAGVWLGRLAAKAGY
jgi:hypothetical protein